eukprot:gene10652-22235_t
MPAQEIESRPDTTNAPLRQALMDAYKQKYIQDDDLQIIKKSGKRKHDLNPIIRSSRDHLNRHPKTFQITDRWWEKPPAIAGEACTVAQQRLCQVESFTGMYKKRFEVNPSCPVSGDYCDRPIRATRLLNSTPVNLLTIPSRAGDFRTEVEWRLQLRPQFN